MTNHIPRYVKHRKCMQCKTRPTFVLVSKESYQEIRLMPFKKLILGMYVSCKCKYKTNTVYYKDDATRKLVYDSLLMIWNERNSSLEQENRMEAI